MDDINLVILARGYAEHYRISTSRVSNMIVGEGALFSRVMAGSCVTTRRYNKVLQWFSDHWPMGLSWPADIPRPASDPFARSVNHRRGRRVKDPHQDNSAHDAKLSRPSGDAPQDSSASDAKLSSSRPATPWAVARFGRDQVNKCWARYIDKNKVPRIDSVAWRTLEAMTAELGDGIAPAFAARRRRRNQDRVALASSNHPLVRLMARSLDDHPSTVI